MNSDTPLDYVLFQLSPRRSRCELFVSGDGKTEKLASGFLKPFVTHLRVAELQASQGVQSIKLEADSQKNAATWFNKGTLERFVRFVSTPEVLELANTFDAEMSQLEGARRIYSEGSGDQLSGATGGSEKARIVAADITKKELLRAIDVRLVAVEQDLTLACARALAAGFTLENVSELLLFADRFSAQRLNEACSKFISLCQRRKEVFSYKNSTSPSLPTQWMGFDDTNIRSSSGSDMSIDEPEVDSSGSAKLPTSSAEPSNSQPAHHVAAEPAAASQQLKPFFRSLVKRDEDKTSEESDPIVTSAEVPQQSGGGSRRLSVQDRINLFESKQKEQTVSAHTITSSTSGGTVRVAGKPEHRRLPSDISMEKSVLRRWSSGSDMSIGLNSSSSSSSTICNDRKESGSTAGALFSSANSLAQSGSKSEEDASGMKDTAASQSQLGFNHKPTGSQFPSSSLSLSQAQVLVSSKDRVQVEDVVSSEDISASKKQPGPDLGKENGGSWAQLSASLGKMQQGGVSSQAAPKTTSKASSDSGEGVGLKEHSAFGTQFKTLSEEHVGTKDLPVLQIPPRAGLVAAKLGEHKDRLSLQSEPRDITREDPVDMAVQPKLETKPRAVPVKTDVGLGPKNPLDSQTPFTASSGKTEGITLMVDPSSPKSKGRIFPGEEQELGRRADASLVPVGKFSVEAAGEDYGVQGRKLHKKTSTPEHIRKLQGKKDERAPAQANAAPAFPRNKTKGSMKIFDSPSSPLMEQAQMTRASKGNQNLNDELQIKAEELERIFAAHKIRIQDDQIASSRRSKIEDVEVEHVSKAVKKRLEEVIPDQLPNRNLMTESLCNEAEVDAELVMKMVDNKECSNNSNREVGNLNPSDDFRGILYEKYMQKRDAKLREEGGAKRAQKEAKMKAMQESLERSHAEMKAKFAGAPNRQDLNSARVRALKMRSFNARSTMKEQTLELLQGEEEVDLQELSDQAHYGQDKSYINSVVGNEHSMSIQSKKFVSIKSVSTPRISPAPIPRPSAKATNSGSMKCRPENPLAQSVPNFSAFKLENTKPHPGHNKVTPRTQSRNFVRSKSSNEETNLVKEDNSRRSQFMRKSSINSGETKDLSLLNSDCSNLSLLKFSKEQIEHNVPSMIMKSGESRPFLRKGNGIGPGAGAGIAKLKNFADSEILKNEEESQGLVNQQEDSFVRVKDGEAESETPFIEETLTTMDFSVDSDSEKPRLSQDSGNSDDPGSENGDGLRSLSQADEDLAASSSKFDTPAENMQESPGESPGSWSSHLQHSFSYAQEPADIDASMASPIGSPASWMSHPLNQMMEADAARMRKKWGSAQIPAIAANASHQSRKDVTKGFKRLLKFGRKSKGAEFLINDWVSASTASEGDDDTEDGRDLATRSSDDLRKSRMGYPVAAYDGFNEDVFPEQVQSLRSSIPIPPENFKLREDHLSGSSFKAPRSFFSLSSFRSKGSESKLR